jgi:hypothetical protein
LQPATSQLTKLLAASSKLFWPSCRKALGRVLVKFEQPDFFPKAFL